MHKLKGRYWKNWRRRGNTTSPRFHLSQLHDPWPQVMFVLTISVEIDTFVKLICSRIVCRTAFYGSIWTTRPWFQINMVPRDKCLHNFGEAELIFSLFFFNFFNIAPLTCAFELTYCTYFSHVCCNLCMF
jgi:hypothetical protein